MGWRSIPSRGRRNASVTRTKVHLRLHVGAFFSQIMPFIKKSHKTQNLSRIEFIPIKKLYKVLRGMDENNSNVKKVSLSKFKGSITYYWVMCF